MGLIKLSNEAEATAHIKPIWKRTILNSILKIPRLQDISLLNFESMRFFPAEERLKTRNSYITNIRM